MRSKQIQFRLKRRLEEDLLQFVNVRDKNVILLLPPLSPQYRFVTHKLVGQFDSLGSVSVGSGEQRRTAVFFKQIQFSKVESTHAKSARSLMESDQKHVSSLPSIETSRRGRGRGRGQRKQSSNVSVPVSSTTRNLLSSDECHSGSALEQRESLSKEVYRKERGRGRARRRPDQILYSPGALQEKSIRNKASRNPPMVVCEQKIQQFEHDVQLSNQHLCTGFNKSCSNAEYALCVGISSQECPSFTLSTKVHVEPDTDKHVLMTNNDALCSYPINDAETAEISTANSIPCTTGERLSSDFILETEDITTYNDTFTDSKGRDILLKNCGEQHDDNGFHTISEVNEILYDPVQSRENVLENKGEFCESILLVDPGLSKRENLVTLNKQLEKEWGDTTFRETLSSGIISPSSKLASPSFNPKHLQEKVVLKEELQVVGKGDWTNIQQTKENELNVQAEVDSVLLGSSCSDSENDNHSRSEDTLVNCIAQRSINNPLQNDLTVVCLSQSKEVDFKPASNNEDNETNASVNPECHTEPIKSKNKLVSGSEKENNIDMTDTKNGVDKLQQERSSINMTSDIKHLVEKSQKQNSNDMTSEIKHLVDISQNSNNIAATYIKDGVDTVQKENSNDMMTDIKDVVDTSQKQNKNDMMSDSKHEVDSSQKQNQIDMMSDSKHEVDSSQKQNNNMAPDINYEVNTLQIQNSNNMTSDIKHAVGTSQKQNSSDRTSDIKHGVGTSRKQNCTDMTSDINHGVDTSQKENSSDMTSDFEHGVDSLQKEKKSKKKRNKKAVGLKEIKTKCKTKKGKEKEKKNGREKRVPTEHSSPESVYQHKNSFDQEEELKSSQQLAKENILSTTQVQENFDENEKNFTADGSDDDNWELLFDDDGECCNPEMLEELSNATGIETPVVRNPRFDYLSFVTPKGIELDETGYSHIVEIFDFSKELQTQDLMQALSSFREPGFEIKWVDDTHALGVFTSEIVAKQAIKTCSGPLLKLRPIREGSKASKEKARCFFEFLQPYKERPKTTKLTAHRMVTGALGLKSHMTREEHTKEREKLKEAREQKRLKEKQKAEAWGD